MQSTTRQSAFDKLIEGGLRKFIAERIDAGKSFERIARDLEADHDLTISASTIFRWARGYGLTET